MTVLADDRVFLRPADPHEHAAAIAHLSEQRSINGVLTVLAGVVGLCTAYYPSPVFALILLGLVLAAGRGWQRTALHRRERDDGQVLELRSDRRTLRVFALTGRRVHVEESDEA